MLTAVHALNVLLPLAYLITAVLYAMVYGGPEAPAVERQRRTAFLGTLALHASYFVVRNLAVGGPAKIDTWTALSSVALSTAVLYAILARSTGQANTGGPVLTAVFLMQTLASAFAATGADRGAAEQLPVGVAGADRDPAQPLAAVGRDLHLIAAARQLRIEQLTQRGFIFNNKNLGFFFHYHS